MAKATEAPPLERRIGMPLRDHFHKPLTVDRDWEDFHAGWAVGIRNDLNRRLPEEFFALAHTHAASNMEIDVATFEETRTASVNGPQSGGTATLPTAVWTPPGPTQNIPATFVEDFEVQIISTTSGRKLVAAIELVSPRNKDRPAEGRAFATKCASYLNQGISLIVVDIVTNRRANLHQQILKLLAIREAAESAEGSLYAVAYRPVRRNEQEEIDLWPHNVRLGEPLPELPLWLTGDLCLPLNLESTYLAACRDSRI